MIEEALPSDVCCNVTEQKEEYGQYQCYISNGNMDDAMCLRAKSVATPSSTRCHNTDECIITSNNDDNISNLGCVIPVLTDHLRMISVLRYTDIWHQPHAIVDAAASTDANPPTSSGKDAGTVNNEKNNNNNDDIDEDRVRHFIYIGTPNELYASISVGDYRPRWLFRRLFSSWALSYMCDIPWSLSLLLRYIISVSASLALLNAAPVYLADGAASLEQMLNIVIMTPMSSTFTTSSSFVDPVAAIAQMSSKQRTIEIWHKRILMTGTSLLVANVLGTFLTLLHN
jgi:hypothetical protein